MPNEIIITAPPVIPVSGIPAGAKNITPGTNPANPIPDIAGTPPKTAAAAIAAGALGIRSAERAAGKPGRHKADCTCDKCKAGITNRRAANIQPARPAGKLGAAETAADSAPAIKILTPEEKEMGREAIRAATHLMDSFALVLVTMAAKKKGIDGRGLDEITEKVPMAKETRKGIADSGAVVLEKYNALRFAPEVSLALFGCSWLSGILMLIVGINRMPDKTETPPATAV